MKTTYYFDSLVSATQAMLIVMMHARASDSVFWFGGLNAQQISTSGLRLEGTFSGLLEALDEVPGALRVDD